MNNIRAIFNSSKIVTVCCIVVFFILILSIFALYLFGGEKLSVEDENMLKTQMDSVLDEYKSAITNFEKKSETSQISLPYSQDILQDKEIQYVEGKYLVDISSNINISVIEGLWVNDGEVNYVNTFTCGVVEYFIKECSAVDVTNLSFYENDLLYAVLQKFYCDYYGMNYNFRNELLLLKNELMDIFDKKISSYSSEALYIQVKKEINMPFPYTIKMSVQATDSTNSCFNMFVYFYRDY